MKGNFCFATLLGSFVYRDLYVLRMGHWKLLQNVIYLLLLKRMRIE